MTDNLHDKLADCGIRIYEVGGAVRDKVMGIPSHDIDFVAVVDPVVPGCSLNYEAAFGYLSATLANLGFTIYLSTPEYGTLRAHFPRDDSRYGKLAADFVLARKDGPSSDGRRPDYVLPGSLEDDLARRDFTVNSLAMSPEGCLVDPHGGLADIRSRTLRFVGDPMTRLREDGLRALRAIRFAVTRQLKFAQTTREALLSPETVTLLAGCSIERRREELDKAFRFDSVRTMKILSHEMAPEFIGVCFSEGLRLSATLRNP